MNYGIITLEDGRKIDLNGAFWDDVNKRFWKCYPFDSESLYFVSTMGDLVNVDTMHVKKARLTKDGYKQYSMSNVITKVNDYPYEHRLVAELFLVNDDPEHNTDVNHLDEDKTNNSVFNLAWSTHKGNTNYGTRNKRIAEKLKQNYAARMDG